VILEGIGTADIPNYRPWVAMPALIHYAGEIHALSCGFRNVAGPQTMRPEGRGIQPGSLRIALDDVANGPRREVQNSRPIFGGCPYPTRTGDRSEYWALRDPGCV
jgi:hypothetical protein